ncbi:beta-glucanase (GH16 family) [Paenibacillus castaneae]|uniref:carbohydrate binding domain-containing protein n=1 Tax=Paenibacillus castaneae TaxID=474957 RepID=UPI000C9ACA18|nr:carbohydrate binding domain-containing protein [Paenibacillus castaneae]NIK76010.1 beta-glucanase (GH16 family) [Paenibacillus castaneae]
MKKQILSVLLVFMMLTSSLPILSAANSAAGEDSVHWGEDSLQKWISKGMLDGYPDGGIQPDRQITRAEFTKLVNTVFRLNAKGTISFTDVQAGAWYSNDIMAVQGAGFISGYPDGSFKPNTLITRQEAAKITAALFQLQSLKGSGLTGFKDYDQVQSYAKAPLEQLLAGEYIKGYPDGTLRPMRPITRAEAVTLLDRLAAEVVLASGSYDHLSIAGNTIINTADVILNEAVIDGDLFLTQGVGEGDVYLNDVEVKGTAYINGGGANSIHFMNAKLHKVVVNKAGGAIRIVLSGKSVAQHLIVESTANVEIDRDASVALLTVEPGVTGTKLSVKGSAAQIDNGGTDTLLNDMKLASGSSFSVQNGITTSRLPATSGQSGGGGTTPTPQPTDEPEKPKEEWKLVWSDEFDGSGENIDANGVNLDKWAYQLGTGSEYGLDGWGNNEQQYYRAENISVADGKLTITAKDDGYDGMPYTSGRIYTQPTFNKTFGKFEARIKMPVGEGIWPAFWMYPKDSEYGTWAASGEIDIMEARGRLPKEVGGTIHYGKNWPNNKYTGASYEFEEGTDITDFHTYGLEWEPGELRWYVDGVLYQKQDNWNSWGADEAAKYTYPAPFDKPFYMILNLAVGGNYDGNRNPDPSLLPGKMEVDYVRVYELAGRPYKTPIEPTIDEEPYPEQYKKPIDGNYVYDSSFNEPFQIVTESDQSLNSEYWNLLYINTFQGNGSVTVDTLDQIKYAKTDITSGGNAVHAVQLIQNVTLGKGRWYKLTFDAKSNANRNMSVKIGGGDNRGWSTYSDVLDAKLTDSLQSYEMVFQMKDATDTLARLEFNMGLSTNPVWIGNVRLQETVSPDPYNENTPKEPLNGNHIYNGSFDLGRSDRLTFWNFDAAGGKAIASVDADIRELHVAITDAGAVPSDIKLEQKGINLIQGNDYQITFKARAEADRSIQVAVYKQDGTLYAAPQEIKLSTEMKEHTVLFTMEHPKDVSGKVAFLLGGELGDIYLDDVSMIRVGELSLDHQFPLKNGDFSNGKANWSEHVQGRYDGWDQTTAFTVENGEMKISLASVGNNPWDVMLMQTDFSLYKGKTYTVSLDVRASTNREMEIVIENQSNTRYLSERVMLTEAKHTFSYELPVQSDVTASFKLLLGKLDGTAALGAHDVFVDNVRVELKDARSAAFPLKNGYFDEGMNNWSTHIQGVYDGASSAVFSADHEGVKAAIANTGENAWDIMLQQGSLALLKGKTYMLTFTARASTPRRIEAIVENSAYFRYMNKAVQLDKATQSYSYEFTMNKDDETSFKLLLGNQAGVTNAAHEVFIGNVRLELKGAKEAAGEKVRSTTTLSMPPVLIPDAADNMLGFDIEITFSDNEAWRTAINAVSVNGTALTAGQYSIKPGIIAINAEVFTVDRFYVIQVMAAGFDDAGATQLIHAADGNLVLNGGMSSGTANWEHWFGDGGDSKYEVKDGAAQITIYNNGGMHPQWNIPVGWSTQLNQSGIKLEAGKAYELSFNAWSSVDRPISIELTGYSSQALLFNITGAADTVYKSTLLPTTNVSLTLKFLLGNVVNGALATPDGEHIIYIGNVSIREAAEI